MIKLDISRKRLLRIRKMHIDGLKQKILDRISNHVRKYASEERYLDLLGYLCINLESILGGEKEDLRRIISEIEEKYFITDRKLDLILEKRKNLNKGYSKTQRVDYLKKFSIENKISNYIVNNSVYDNVTSFQTFIGNLKVLGKDWKERIKEIFDYDEFTQDYSGWGAYKLVSKLNIEVCPYCNRQFINTFEKKDKRVRATLDHFYAKSLYPYLALSMYNLIPSCYYCNSSLKGDEDFYTNEAIYPYKEQFSDNASFITESDDYLYLLGLSTDFDLKIEIKDGINQVLKNKIERSIEVFALNDMYRFHKDYVSDLLKSAFINDESRINELYNLYRDIFKSKEEVMQAVFLNYFKEDDLGKRVLSKLISDICRQLGIAV
jgi:hypothetical protein